jgi:hypothetical protein
MPPRAGLVAPSGQQAFDRDVLVEVFPMNAARTHRKVLTLRGRRFQETRKPSQGDAESSAVREFEPKIVLIEPDAWL